MDLATVSLIQKLINSILLFLIELHASNNRRYIYVQLYFIQSLREYINRNTHILIHIDIFFYTHIYIYLIYIILRKVKHDQTGSIKERKPCWRLACQTSSILNKVFPHSFTFPPSKACTIPATRQALITFLGRQFCCIIKYKTLKY